MRTKASLVLAVISLLALITTPVRTQTDTPQKALPNFHRINEALFRGAQPKPGGLDLLRQSGIKTIVNLRDDDRRAQEEGTNARRAGLRYFNIPLGRWSRPDDKEIEQVLSVINTPENQPVFVHCQHGADRTGVVIAVYRMAHDGWSSERAKNEAKHYGLKAWQFGIKNYIDDFYKRRAHQTKSATQ
jgi:protein tyrosine/serine phosphatase